MIHKEGVFQAVWVDGDAYHGWEGRRGRGIQQFSGCHV